MSSINTLRKLSTSPSHGCWEIVFRSLNATLKLGWVLDQQFLLMQIFSLVEVSPRIVMGRVNTIWWDLSYEDHCVQLYKMCTIQRHQAKEGIDS